MGYREEIEARKEEYIGFLQKLVSYDSEILEAGKHGLEEGIQSYLSEYFIEMGAEVDAFEPDNTRISQYKGFNRDHEYDGRKNVVAV